LLTGHQTSYYTDPDIVRVAAIAADVARDYCAKSGLNQASNADTLAQFVLRAVYQTACDAYADGPPREGKHVVTVLRDVLASSAAGDLLPPHCDPQIVSVFEFRAHFVRLLNERADQRICSMSVPIALMYTFYVTGQLAFTSTDDMNHLVYIYVSLINFIMSGSLFLPHVVYDPARRRAHLMTSLGYGRTMGRIHGVSVDPWWIERGEFLRETRMRDRYHYAYQTYADLLRDVWSIPENTFPQYFKYAIATFPATLMSLFDLFVSPSGPAYSERDDTLAHMSVVTGFSEMRLQYDDVRNTIWYWLSRAVPFVPLAILMKWFSLMESLRKDRQLLGSFQIEGTELYIENEPLVKIVNAIEDEASNG
jgi:hypothetical protein